MKKTVGVKVILTLTVKSETIKEFIEFFMTQDKCLVGIIIS
jgi:hypothetical protein